ncbi:MAG: tRNA guanosine(34) transglycosylase Tgt [Bowdeniella nasicola]|nr:tRNA guanosine(34) transglycosylase Tgt [Bowdeniella nasicola]
MSTVFRIEARLEGRAGRSGVIETPHGQIRTPAFIPVATQATVKALLPETVAELGAQAVLANAYHLYLQPGTDIVAQAGGLSQFMNWPGPTFTDSGGFQVLSLGSGFKKVLSEQFSGAGTADTGLAADAIRRAHVDDDGVWFTSHRDGTKHRFTPEVSMRAQFDIGADIIFAFDELTTLLNSHEYQVEALGRTQAWARRCLAEHRRLLAANPHRPRQLLFGVVQGAQYEPLRRRAARELAAMEVEGYRFAGFGIGGALEKERLGQIVSWVTDELPEDRPRHLLGISEPDDLFAAIEAGADTFDCVSPSRVARTSAVYTARGRTNLTRAENRRAFRPIEDDCPCYTCTHYTRAYLHHLFKAKEMLASTLATVHNEYFIVTLVNRIREALAHGDFDALRAEVLGAYYGS